MSNDNNPDEPDLSPIEDLEMIQAVVVSAAIQGHAVIRSQLPRVLEVFEEPFRTVAAVLQSKLSADEFVDRHAIGLALQGCRLTRLSADGKHVPLTTTQVMSLVLTNDLQPGQAEAYLEILQVRLQTNQAADLKQSALELAQMYGDRPDALLAEVERLATEARKRGVVGAGDHPSELLELIPYLQALTSRQTGGEFLGLDSGFSHFNNLCNGLDTGLAIVAAPPGAGKTTLSWQIGCQAAQANKVPVIFVSMEQSKDDLRAKALARLSRLLYRKILRGRLRLDNQQEMEMLLEAARQYALIASYLTIIEGDDTTTVDKIGEVAAAKLNEAGADRCLIIVDYLQVLPLKPTDGFRTTSTKDRVDLHVSALRRIARKLNSPVLAISSENRAGYKSKSLDVFKESGAIEYSADLAMVLTPDQRNVQGADSEFRPMDLNVVKNRNGERGVIKFKFYAKRAEFVETGKEDLVDSDEE